MRNGPAIIDFGLFLSICGLDAVFLNLGDISNVLQICLQLFQSLSGLDNTHPSITGNHFTELHGAGQVVLCLQWPSCDRSLCCNFTV